MMCPIVGVLVIIALAATVIALSLQMYFGRLPLLALLGHLLAAFGATGFALCRRGRHFRAEKRRTIGTWFAGVATENCSAPLNRINSNCTRVYKKVRLAHRC